MTPQPEIRPGTMRQTSTLVVDEDGERRGRTVAELGRRFGLVEGANSPRRADSLMSRCRFDCLVLDLESLGGARAWLGRLRESGDDVPVVVCCEPDGARVAIGLLRYGIAEILIRPFEPAALAAVIQRVRGGNDSMSPPTVPRGGQAGQDIEALLIGESAAVVEIRELIERVAPLPSAVLVEGERGTGKALVARLLHHRSRRRGAFVPLDCAATSADQLESELFGHAKGAFPGAHQVRDGLIVAARGGTLFLDQISEIPPVVQARLNRALEDGAIRPVGSDRQVRTDVRVVASTCRDLAGMVRQGEFRDDLYHRLNVVAVGLPPLRDRPEDIRALAVFFMESLARDLGFAPIPFSPEQIDRMSDFSWPGNVLELKNFVERTLMMGEFSAEGLTEADHELSRVAIGYPPEWTLEQVKQHHMHMVLKCCGGNRSEAARCLDISRKTLERKLGPRRPGTGGRMARQRRR